MNGETEPNYRLQVLKQDKITTERALRFIEGSIDDFNNIDEAVKVKTECLARINALAHEIRRCEYQLQEQRIDAGTERHTGTQW